jgi:hypothetical protein
VLGELIRRSFIPRGKRRRIVELDFKVLEVRVGYCYHRDPMMRRYLLDSKNHDMHRDAACDCFILEPEQVSKEIRYSGKSDFVFPQFYGSYYIDCAKALWAYMLKHNLTTTDGISVKKNLRQHGIKELGACDPRQKPKRGTLEHRIAEVEKMFWQDRFKVYDRWKKDWYAQYMERGWFRMKTGFVVEGHYKRNQVINSPVQGAAFHCLLWSLIELQKWLNKKKMKTLIIGEIHDSMLLDSPEEEVDEVIEKAVEIMTELLRRAWDWLIIPLEVEVETSSKNWFEKEPYKLS